MERDTNRLIELATTPEPRMAGLGGPAPGQGVTELLLIRHGDIPVATVANDDDALTAVGREQAEVLGEYLARHKAIDAIYASPLQRTMETAAAIAKRQSLTIQPMHDLREREMRLPPGMTLRDILGDEGLLAWRARFRREKLIDPEGLYGESGAELRARVVPAVEAIIAAHPGQRVAIVSHGPTLNAYLAHILDCNIDMLFQPRLTSVSIVWAIDDMRDLRVANSMAHFGVI